MKTLLSNAAFWLGAIVAIVNLCAFHSGLNLGYVLFVSACVLMAFASQRLAETSFAKFLYPTLALASAAFIYGVFPNIFVDDTGFVIRYMNMARQGCFYCYNLSDGPVFGISSIIYGLLTCGLALTGIASNESIIIGLNFVGLAVACYFLLLIFKTLLKQDFLVLLSFAFVLLAATRLLFSATAGLETNVHLAIVLAGLYFFFSERRALMWLFFGLSVVSKLDTVPLVVAFSLVHLFEKRALYLGDNAWRNLGSAFLLAGLPIFLFLILSFSLFNGPLPQSAYAKLYHHAHPSEHWFPFLELFLERGARLALFACAMLIPLAHAVFSFAKGTFQLRNYALFLAFLATMALYYVYNPVERMVWYYALPEVLLYAQLMLSMGLLVVASEVDVRSWKRSVTASFIFAALCVAAYPMTSGEKQWMDRYLQTVELERLAIGHHMAQLLEGDTLVSAHGHFGAYFKGYVMDLSGLNSTLVTDYHRNTDSLLTAFHPRYYINHASAQNEAIAAAHGYHPIQEWTAIEAYDYPKWVLWERGTDSLD